MRIAPAFVATLATLAALAGCADQPPQAGPRIVSAADRNVVVQTEDGQTLTCFKMKPTGSDIARTVCATPEELARWQLGVQDVRRQAIGGGGAMLH